MVEPDDLTALNLKLGRRTSEGVLDPVPRSLGRQSLGESAPPFYGVDLWNAHEVSFLLPSGKPVVYHMRICYDADTRFMVESKSLKLFLNAQNSRVYQNVAAFGEFVSDALRQCVAGVVDLRFYGPDALLPVRTPIGLCVDDLEFVAGSGIVPVGAALGEKGDFALYSHLLQSHCPVTDQPDWGCVSVVGRGPAKPEPASFLAYIVSLRGRQAFHESCCEKIFVDLHRALKPGFLEVTCYYTRRGGLDINPRRSTREGDRAPFHPVWRQ